MLLPEVHKLRPAVQVQQLSLPLVFRNLMVQILEQNDVVQTTPFGVEVERTDRRHLDSQFLQVGV